MRPWEPSKFASASEQEQNLANLIAWVKTHESRTDEHGLQAHRRLFDEFAGRKFELTHVANDAVLQVLTSER